MFITNGLKAQLVKYNRPVEIDDDTVSTGVYDDEYTTTEDIVLCPYNQDIRVAFGTYTVPEAEGYFIVKRATDVKEGDQIIFNGDTYTILKVKDNWLWNRIENFTVAVK